jgi:hypothetical protein
VPWLANGDARCDSCPATYPAIGDRAITSQALLVSNWGSWDGKLGDGETGQFIICPRCRREQRKTRVIRSAIQDVALPGLE